MTGLLASVPLKLREITSVDFVPMAALLVLDRKSVV